MSRPLLRWLSIAGIALIVLVGYVPSWQRQLAQKNWIADQYRFGDLYNTTNLARLKEQNFAANKELDSTDLPTRKQAGVHLYTIGDSFTDIDTSFYAAEKNVHVWIGNGRQQIRLDTAKRNILVIQIIERVLQERFRDHSWTLYTTRALVDSTCNEPLDTKPAGWLETTLNTRYGSELNSRLEFLLFNNDLTLLVKEWKAALLFGWFGRASGARLSTNQQHGFYELEVDSTCLNSSFRHLNSADIDLVVNHLNRVTKYYREMGFKEIYLTLIPNKSTVLNPTLGTYNHQIERIERHPALQPTVISLYSTICKRPNWYHRGDGHWTQEGRRHWLGIVNGLVRQ